MDTLAQSKVPYLLNKKEETPHKDDGKQPVSEDLLNSSSPNLLEPRAIDHEFTSPVNMAVTVPEWWDHLSTLAPPSGILVNEAEEPLDDVVEVENVFIPMDSEVSLSARLWLPKEAGPQNRVPGKNINRNQFAYISPAYI